MLMRTLLSVFVWGFLSISPALSQNYLTTDDGEKFFDGQGGFLLAQAPDAAPPNTNTDDGVWLIMPAGNKLHSVMQLATWGEPPNRVMVSLYLDITPDKQNLRIKGFAQQDGKVITVSWVYLNNVVVATCQSDICDYMLPVARMKVGQNDVLFAYRTTDNISYGTTTKISKP